MSKITTIVQFSIPREDVDEHLSNWRKIEEIIEPCINALHYLQRKRALMPERVDQGRAILHGAQAVASTGFQVGEVPAQRLASSWCLRCLQMYSGQLLDLDGAFEGFEVPSLLESVDVSTSFG